MRISTLRMNLVFVPFGLVGLAGCAASGTSLPAVLDVTPTPRPEVAATKKHPLDHMIVKYAAAYKVPVKLVRHVVKRESNYNPKAYSKGNYGLMQIRYKTAKGMGYRGTPKGLYDPETNLKYAVKYLRGAYVTARGDQKEADWLYRTGYYYTAKRRGLLEEAGLTRAGTAIDMATADIAETPDTTVVADSAPVSDQPSAAAAAPTQVASAASENAARETAAGKALPGVAELSPAADNSPPAPGEAATSMAFSGTTPSDGGSGVDAMSTVMALPASAPLPTFRPGG